MLDTPFGVRCLVSDAFLACAKKAYAWLIFQHASGVRKCPNSYERAFAREWLVRLEAG